MGRKLFILIFVILFYIMGGYGITERLDESNLSSTYANVSSDTSIDSIALEYTNNQNSFDSNYIDNISGANDGIHLNETMVQAIIPNQIVWLLNRLIEDRRTIDNQGSTPIPTVESTISRDLSITPDVSDTPFIWTLIATPIPNIVATDATRIDSEVAVIAVPPIEINETPTRSNTSTPTFVPEIIIENTIEPTSTPTEFVVLATTYTTIIPTMTPTFNVQPTNTNISEISNTSTSTPDEPLVVTPTWTPESVSTPTPLVDWNATPPTPQPTLTFRPSYTPEYTPTPYPTSTILPTLTLLPTLTKLP